jgi:hypothetical protein
MTDKPRIENAPGLTWKPRKDGWEARWQCRTDIARKGYPVKTARVWAGAEPNAAEQAMIADRCRDLQDEMLSWAKSPELPQAIALDGTVAALVDAFKSDPDSPFHEKRYATRVHYEILARLVRVELGERMLADITGRDLLHWHRQRYNAGKVTMAHSMIGMFRMLLGYGVSLQGDAECLRLQSTLHSMRFPMGKSRTTRLTAAQAQAIIDAAHVAGLHSLAMAQAFQFECMFRQKDVIGEWVPDTEPGASEVTHGARKWLRGIRWEEIDEHLILRHVTSKRQKEVSIDLKQAPMVLAELRRLDIIPKRGPIIVHDRLRRPWHSQAFRVAWREMATSVGVPKEVRNMDSRAGAISEATDAGAELEHVRHAATHSDIAMTQKYSRGSEEKIAEVQRLRVEQRNKTGTKNGN